jgi:hypothetical protein
MRHRRIFRLSLFDTRKCVLRNCNVASQIRNVRPKRVPFSAAHEAMDWCWWLLAKGTGEDPREYIRRVQETYGSKSLVCGFIWEKGYVAYRCRVRPCCTRKSLLCIPSALYIPLLRYTSAAYHNRLRLQTCGLSACSAICHTCFVNGPHRDHDYLMYRSVAGGCCDCGGTLAPHHYLKKKVISVFGSLRLVDLSPASTPTYKKPGLRSSARLWQRYFPARPHPSSGHVRGGWIRLD